MIIKDNPVEVLYHDPYRTKYIGGHAAIAEYLHVKGPDFWDRDSGDVESPVGVFAQCGRWILQEDDRGFVTVVKLPNEEDANRAFNDLDEEYGAWALEPGEDDDD